MSYNEFKNNKITIIDKKIEKINVMINDKFKEVKEFEKIDNDYYNVIKQQYYLIRLLKQFEYYKIVLKDTDNIKCCLLDFYKLKIMLVKNNENIEFVNSLINELKKGSFENEKL
jgi:hypothetical protein